MINESIRQILVNGCPVGLEAVIAVVEKFCAGNSDDEIASLVLECIAAKNYIPSSARSAYTAAVLQEYRIVRNLPAEEEAQTGLQILVPGMGCTRCNQLQSDLRDVLSELHLAADHQQ